MPAAWETITEEPIADCRIFQLVKRQCRHPVREQIGEFSVIKSPDWVQVIPLLDDGGVLMVNQWRFGASCFSWETPGGLIQPNEPILDAAARELREETGYSGTNARQIGKATPNPAIQNNTVYFVLVENCQKQDDTEWDEHEELQTGRFKRDQIRKMCRDGQIHHALALNALYFLEQAR